MASPVIFIMRLIHFIGFLGLALFPFRAITQSVESAWMRNMDTITETLIISDGYYMKAVYTTKDHQFIKASGGIMKVLPAELEMEVEFDSEQAEEVGNMHLISYQVADKKLRITHHEKVETWDFIDDGKPGLLQGAWLFSGRRNNPEDTISPYTPGVRKTMKILSGTRFQWAAFNTETKAFLGTGGGTYTSQNDQYVENIDFFSRDNNRVGASLTFIMDLQKPHWYHSGKSSKGDPIYERWTLRKTFLAP